jgi:hypothetical protein
VAERHARGLNGAIAGFSDKDISGSITAFRAVRLNSDAESDIPKIYPQDGWWARQDLNLGPMDYESTALTAELRARRQDGFNILST